MIFAAGRDEREHIERVAERGVRGRHVASEAALRDIHRRGKAMLRGLPAIGGRRGQVGKELRAWPLFVDTDFDRHVGAEALRCGA